MNEFTKSALAFLSKNWGVVLENASGADLIGVNRATLRTRIQKGQALAMRATEGRERARVEYTPGQLAANLLYDALARFNVVPGSPGEQMAELQPWVGWIRDEIVTGPQNIRAIIRVHKRGETAPTLKCFQDAEELEAFTGEPVVVIPIGEMMVRFAAQLFAKHDPDAMRKALKA